MRPFSKLITRSSRLAYRTIPLINLNTISPMKPLLFNQNYSFSSVNTAAQNIVKSTYEGQGFYVQQLLVGCLAIYSYYIESNGQAWIIDPQNDISKYDQILKQRNTKLNGVFLTHYHADYIAGHIQLQKSYNCKVYMGPKAIQKNGFVVLKDLQKVKLGNIYLELLHTPGHTEQSSCVVVYNRNGKQDIVFSGDTVFLNQVGRPDLAVKTNLSAKDLASMLFDSIQKFKKIENNVRIYPGHGSGSACGKSIGKGDFCDIQTQKKNNYALKQSNKSNFVDLVIKQMPKPPAYFGYNATLNKFDQFDYEKAYKASNVKLNIDQFNKLRKQGVTIIDIRGIPELKKGIIQGSLCIDYNGGFANWIGTLISPKEKIILFGDALTSDQAVKRLLRIGYVNLLGYSNFKIQQWKAKNLPTYNFQFTQNVFQQNRTVLDVRKPQQWATGVANTNNLVTFELQDLFKNTSKLDKSKKYVTHCKSGFRARIAYSHLKNKGFDVKVFPFAVQKINNFKPFN